MKKMFLILITGLALVSCEKDPQCPTEDYVGTYMGNTDCSLGINSEEGDQVVVSKIDDKTLQIAIQNEVLTVKIKGCELDVDNDIRSGTGTDGTASLNGNSLNVTYIKKAASIIVEECAFTGQRI